MKPSTVIVPLDMSDLSQRALGPGCGLAMALEARLLLVTARWEGVPEDPAAFLADEAKGLAVDRVETRVVGDLGAPDAILAVAEDLAAGLVCMATHGRGGLERAVLGSVAEEVVRRAGAPVMLIGPQVQATPHFDEGSIVVGYDGSPLSECVVGVAASWAHALERPVVVVTVGDDPHVLGRSAETIAAQEVHERMVGRLRSEGVKASSEIVAGELRAKSLADHAANVHAPLIILTTHGRSGLSRLAMGSVAGRIVHGARCPVLVVRPRLSGTGLA